MGFQDWQVGLCMRHLAGLRSDKQSAFLYGPHMMRWGFAPPTEQWDNSTLPSATRRLETTNMLAFMLRYMSYVHLNFEFGAITDGGDGVVHQLNMMHWCAIDNIRFLILALNASHRPKTLHIAVRIKTMDTWTGEGEGEGCCTLIDLRHLVQKFEALRDDIMLDVDFYFDEDSIRNHYESVCPSDDYEPQQLYEQYLDFVGLDDKYISKLQDGKERSKNFPHASLDCLMPQWVKLLTWVREAFGYVCQTKVGVGQGAHVSDELTGNVGADFYAALGKSKGETVNQLLKKAWEAHDAGDVERFRAAKGQIMEVWKAQQKAFARVMEEI